MAIQAAIFDMDGLLIDSEPLWQQAANEVLQSYKIRLSTKEYETTTGLRTTEFISYWFNKFGLPAELQPPAVEQIIILVKQKIQQYPSVMPGVPYIIDYFIKRNFRIGLATSSPMVLVEEVIDQLQIRHQLDAIVSAEALPYGKPHPEVYLNCASALDISPLDIVCFEDSFNGMIAVKAARMKCVVVPAGHLVNDARWGAADLKIGSLQNFNDLLLQHLV